MGLILTLTRFGVLASFIFLFFADRIGPAPGRCWLTIVGFTLANFATGFANTKTQFVVLQFIARLFLTAEFSLAVIMVGEEFPARMRGRAISVLGQPRDRGRDADRQDPGLGAAAAGGREQRAGRPGTHDGVDDFEPGRHPTDGAPWRSLYVLGLLPLAAHLRAAASACARRAASKR